MTQTLMNGELVDTPAAIAAQQQADATPSLPALIAYANRKQALLMSAGVVVNLGTAQAPVNVLASTDAASMGLLNGAWGLAQANSAFTAQWIAGNAVVELTAAQIIALFDVVHTFIQATFTANGTVLTALAAQPPGITSYAQIDAAAWPSNT